LAVWGSCFFLILLEWNNFFLGGNSKFWLKFFNFSLICFTLCWELLKNYSFRISQTIRLSRFSQILCPALWMSKSLCQISFLIKVDISYFNSILNHFYLRYSLFNYKVPNVKKIGIFFFLFRSFTMKTIMFWKKRICARNSNKMKDVFPFITTKNFIFWQNDFLIFLQKILAQNFYKDFISCICNRYCFFHGIFVIFLLFARLILFLDAIQN